MPPGNRQSIALAAFTGGVAIALIAVVLVRPLFESDPAQPVAPIELRDGARAEDDGNGKRGRRGGGDGREGDGGDGAGARNLPTDSAGPAFAPASPEPRRRPSGGGEANEPDPPPAPVAPPPPPVSDDGDDDGGETGDGDDDGDDD